MKKKYITRLPDQIGAFLRASEIVSSLGGNIVRVSYNKSVDVNTLFIDVSASPEQIDKISEALIREGYIDKSDNSVSVLLIEMKILNVPGAILPMLELLRSYNFAITYMSSTENGSDYQNFKMGIHIDNGERMNSFLSALSELCEFKIIDYDNTEKYLDNTIFYISFATKIAEKLNLPKKLRNKIMVYSNMIIQQLDDIGKPVYKTFDVIANFADMVVANKGSAYYCKLYNIGLAEGVIMYVIEPACGANMYVISKGDELLFVDTGFACYREEVVSRLSIMIPDYEKKKKELILTHVDIDHCGLADMFDKVYVTKTSYENFLAENEGRPNIREGKDSNLPYYKISRIISGYNPPPMSSLVVIGEKEDPSVPLQFVTSLTLLGEKFDIYEGNGGHVGGEVVIVCERLGVLFTGDIMVNVKGFSKPQYEFNLLAPYLMTSVNMDSRQAAIERNAMLSMFDLTKYHVCCGHGAVIHKGEYTSYKNR